MAVSKGMILSSVRVLAVWLLVLQSVCYSFKPAQAAKQLRVGFYDGTCANAEQIVTSTIQDAHSADNTITASLIRMFFHDCFVQGCDASILLDGTGTPDGNTEQNAGPNLSVRGFDVIANAKAKLESACGAGVVSCADIIALAARDSVNILGGPKYDVPTGRFDGLQAGDPSVLPGPSFTIDQALQPFLQNGLTLKDMVNLLGAHTVGVAQCQFFQDRLSDFQGSGAPDPTLDPTYLATLQGSCPTPDTNVALDDGSEFLFDNSYFNNVLRNKGLLQIDAELKSDRRTRPLVSSFATHNSDFNRDFVTSMIKLGQVGVLTSGTVRTVCNLPAGSSFEPLAKS